MINRLNGVPAIVRAAEDADATFINAEHEAGQRSQRESLEHYRRCGERLLKVKAKLKHGEWLAWLKKNVKIKERRARHYMQLAKSVVTTDLEEVWRVISGNASPDDDKDEPTGEAPPPIPKSVTVPQRQESDDEGGGDDDDEEDEAFHDHPVDAEVADRTEFRLPATPEDVEERRASGKPIPIPVITPKPRSGKIGKPSDYVLLDDWKKLSAKDRAVKLATQGNSHFNAQTNESIEWALWSWNPVTGCRHDCPGGDAGTEYQGAAPARGCFTRTGTGGLAALPRHLTPRRT